MKRTFPILTFICLIASTSNLSAHEQAETNIEEQRVEKAQQVMPMLKDYFEWSAFKGDWPKVSDFSIAQRTMNKLGDELWQYSKHQAQLGKIVDDRPLYWTRLAIQSFIKSTQKNFTQIELESLVEVFEKSSRGYSDNSYVKSTDKRIFLTGFDPFLLDRNLKQSNPSGLAALLLDGTVVEYHTVVAGIKKTITAEINTVMVPVRYGDFDQGEIESLLAPFYALNSVDLIATLSMGRSDFDLEHFPGLRRSATAPDNLNVYTGANKTNPLVPSLLAAPLIGDEFVLFSLPYQAMMKAEGSYKINDNRGVTILVSGKSLSSKAEDITANSLSELTDKVSVQGGGGGYLSNEISYRSIVLRNRLGSTIPTGHIHTPRISGFDAEINRRIIAQIKAMLVQALAEI
jgi:pyrrolidone-carboxylate peptidase